MKFKVFFIMILILLAALIGAAQEVIVVYEGAETTHNVENHSGSDYLWEVYKNLNPDIPAEPTEFYFTGDANTNEVTVHWVRAGMYYLKVNETDVSGCINAKALAISVVSNNRSIGFEQIVSSACYNADDNSFGLPIRAFNDTGDPLEESYYPLIINYTVDDIQYSQALAYDNQVLSISDDMFEATSESDNSIGIEIVEAFDNANIKLEPSGQNTHSRTIYAIPKLAFDLSEIKLEQNSVFEHIVVMPIGKIQDAIYYWKVEPIDGTSTDLSLISDDRATVFWDGELGDYMLQVYAVDGNGCFSDTVYQKIELVKSSDNLIVSAGNDTLVGVCNTYQLRASVSDTTGLTYLWEPDDNLNDPTILNPIFTPGVSTTFILTVTLSSSIEVKDTVTIEVDEIYANAGDDFVMESGATAMLDGTGSDGEQLQYLWRTENGIIENGQNTATAIISSPGTYFLEIEDYYGCIDSDSVVVSLLTYAPVAVDDYDTTNFQSAVRIPVLDNDYDQDGDLDPTSLSIQQYPLNGSVFINYDDYTVTYTPNDGFVGNDVFEYQICDLTAKCDNAYVYVTVNQDDFFIPEAFTPNGDNINDFFEILGIEIYEGNSLSIVNRWGKAVYEARNYGIDTAPKFWDGTWQKNGGDVPTGTYYYILDLGNGQKPIAGSIYIDR